jgi:hypothetical protein
MLAINAAAIVCHKGPLSRLAWPLLWTGRCGSISTIRNAMEQCFRALGQRTPVSAKEGTRPGALAVTLDRALLGVVYNHSVI